MKRSSLKEIILVMLLFTLLVISVFLLTLYQASSYQQIVEQHEQQETVIMPLSYLNMKLKQADNAQSVALFSKDSLTYLRITEQFDGKPYYTYIYVYDQGLYELLTAADNPEPTSGTWLMNAEGLTMTYQDGYYLFTLTALDASIKVVVR
ncbi:MAG: DUF4860 domain-containing protein [Erysipelotrichaceae bacterium]|nr:DUF4860 domain-containing protein [Erysipelotrichaceae bacterium]